MGYAFYTLPDGREAGYGVAAVCDESDCAKQIDRGLAYCCGGDPYSDEGCHGYFCYDHLFFNTQPPFGPQLCEACLKNRKIDEPT